MEKSIEKYVKNKGNDKKLGKQGEMMKNRKIDKQGKMQRWKKTSRVFIKNTQNILNTNNIKEKKILI